MVLTLAKKGRNIIFTYHSNKGEADKVIAEVSKTVEFILISRFYLYYTDLVSVLVQSALRLIVLNSYSLGIYHCMISSRHGLN
jgi:hypothetical protein